MASFRPYFVDSGTVTIGTTTATPMLYIQPSGSADMNISALRVSVEGISSPAPASNASLLFSLNKVTGTVGGGATVTGAPVNGGTTSSTTSFKSAATAALTGLTASTEYWAHPVPYAAGSSWGEVLGGTGFERNIPPGGTYAVYFTAQAGAGSGCTARVTLDYGE
jgi:hypothetical protein